jgi:hypothetical protein
MPAAIEIGAGDATDAAAPVGASLRSRAHEASKQSGRYEGKKDAA